MSSEVFGNLLVISMICAGLLFFFIWIASLVWVYQDARQRDKTAVLWLLIVSFTWPFGVVVYYLLRDEKVVL